MHSINIFYRVQADGQGNSEAGTSTRHSALTSQGFGALWYGPSLALPLVLSQHHGSSARPVFRRAVAVQAVHFDAPLLLPLPTLLYTRQRA